MKTSKFINVRLGVAAAATTFLLTGCGLAETAAVAASQAETAAEQAKQGKELEAKIQRDIDAANQAAADVRDTAEGESQ